MPPKRKKTVPEISAKPTDDSVIFANIDNKRELLGELMRVHDRLSALSQDPEERPHNVSVIAANLLHENVIGNKDKEIRLLVACCLVDVLRVFAPQAPYNDEELLKVFRIVIAQLRSFGSSDLDTFTGSKIFYILNSLSVDRKSVV